MGRKRMLAGLLSVVLLLALLAGCGKKPSAEPAQPDPEPTPPAEAPAEPPPPVSEPEPEGFHLPENVPVKNNGGYFLGLGDYVYFREYSAEAFSESALFGTFLSSPTPSADSTLCVYDSRSWSVVHSVPDVGCGPLWYAGGKLWLTRAEADGSFSVYTLLPDGSEPTRIAPGSVAGVSEGGLIAIKGDASRLALLKDGKETASAAPAEQQVQTFCGFCGESMIYTRHDYETGVTSVLQLDADGALVTLGTLPLPESDDSSTVWELEQMLPDGENAFLLFARYEGTGHFYCGALAVKIHLGQANSLTTVDLGDVQELEEAPVLHLSDGSVSSVPAIPGTVSLSEGSYGDLTYADSPFSALRLIPNFTTRSPFEDGGAILQTGETVGDSVYLAVAAAIPAPEDDIGWRQAYRLERMYYLRVPVEENSQAETLTGPIWTGGDDLTGSALLALKFGLTEGDILATDPTILCEVDNDDGLHEPLERKWILVTALCDDVQVRVETSDVSNELSYRISWEGGFLPGELLCEQTLHEGDTIGVLASLPWTAEARVSARHGGAFGDYVFGQDNWLYGESGNMPIRYVSGKTLPAPDYTDEDQLWALLDGPWVYRDPDTGEATDVFLFDRRERSLNLMASDFTMDIECGRLYTETDGQPDLLCLRAGEMPLPEALSSRYGDTVPGEYLVDCIVTDTEELLWLRQANNGDGALSDLIPGAASRYAFLLHRYRGGDALGEAQNGTSFPALVWKYDAARQCAWLSPASQTELDESGQPVWSVADSHRVLLCGVNDAQVVQAFEQCGDKDYPLTYFQVTLDDSGAIASLGEPQKQAE